MISLKDFEKEMKKDLKECEISVKHKNSVPSIRVVGSNHAIEFLILELLNKLEENVPKEIYNEMKNVIIDYLNLTSN